MKSIEQETKAITQTQETKKPKGVDFAKQLLAECREYAEKEKALKQSGPKFKM